MKEYLSITDIYELDIYLKLKSREEILNILRDIEKTRPEFVKRFVLFKRKQNELIRGIKNENTNRKTKTKSKTIRKR